MSTPGDPSPMTVYVALLRAVNVGGKNKVPMAELRTALGDRGLRDVATYIQSGNIVCASELSASEVAAVVHDAIVAGFGHDITVIVRTAAEIAALVAGFPYQDADPKSSGVVFLDGEAESGLELDASGFAPDECELAASATDVYVNCPTRFSQTKLTAAWVEKQTGRAGTRRNRATLDKLHIMAGG